MNSLYYVYYILHNVKDFLHLIKNKFDQNHPSGYEADLLLFNNFYPITEIFLS